MTVPAPRLTILEPNLLQRFRLVKEIGRGSFGQVLLVTQGGHPFAFKLLGPRTCEEAAEVTKAARLRHPSIACVFGEGLLEDGRQGIVCEFVDGPTLKAVLTDRRSGRLECGELWGIAEGIAEGIDHSLAERVLHRDLKPANLMIDRHTWQPKIVDFGLASGIGPDGSLASTLSKAGTLLYMPPEILTRQGQWGRRGDIYSFAAILFECLTGRSHLHGPISSASAPTMPTTVPDLIEVVRTGTIFPPDDFPRQAWQVLRRALSADRNERHESATALVREFREAWLALLPGRPRNIPSPLPQDDPAAWPKRLVHPVDGAEMVLVPGQTFLMGSNSAGKADNRPEHPVELASYYIDVCPVTNRQFDVFFAGPMRSRPWQRFYLPGVNETHPVRGVTYSDCLGYCRWAGKSLPTEAQWECAAKGGSSFNYLYPRGNDLRQGDGYFGQATTAGPFPVGMHAPNPLDLFDLAGNVAEWVLDWYAEGVYKRRAQRTDPDPWVREGGERRGIRGGSWASSPAEVSSVTRDSFNPEDIQEHIGFRTVWRPSVG